MFWIWIKTNLEVYITKNKQDLKLKALFYGLVYLILILAFCMLGIMHSNGKLSPIENPSGLDLLILELVKIAPYLLILTILLPGLVYAIYRFYCSFVNLRDSYKRFVNNNGKIKEVEEYDPYRKS